MRPHSFAVLLGSQNGFAVTVAEAHGCLGIRQIEAEANAVERGAAGEGERGERQEKLPHD
jgi:hypothetical protein